MCRADIHFIQVPLVASKKHITKYRIYTFLDFGPGIIQQNKYVPVLADLSTTKWHFQKIITHLT